MLFKKDWKSTKTQRLTRKNSRESRKNTYSPDKTWLNPINIELTSLFKM